MIVAAPAALAEPTAVDEYGLQLPGVHSTDKVRIDPLADIDPTRGQVQGGVVGETHDAESPLATAISAISGPLGIAIPLGVLALIWFGFRPTRAPVARIR